MSVAGLGMSLGHSVHAKSDPPSQSRLIRIGLPEGWKDFYVDVPNPDDAVDPVVPPVPLDKTLAPADERLLESARTSFSGQRSASGNGGSAAEPAGVSSLSPEDAAAEALSMVLMATPPSSLVATEHSQAIGAPGHALDHAFARTPDDRKPPAAALTPLPARTGDSAMPVGGRDRAPDSQADSTVPTSTVTPGHSRGVVVGLDFGLTLDLNLDLGPTLDLDLDLGRGSEVAGVSGLSLDINLDVGPALDLELELPLLADVRPQRTDPRARAPIAAFERPTPPPPDSLHAAASCRADPVARWNDLEAGIVVASHTERVMRSLEALLSGDDPVAGRFGAQTQEVMVTSEAEKALRLLASTRHKSAAPRDWSFRPQIAEPPADGSHAASQFSSVQPPADASEAQPPGELSNPTRRSERSPIGAGLHAISDRKLDKVRGGFTTSTGLQVSFGIERTVLVNGNLVAKTNFNVSENGKVTSTPGSGNLTLVQNGPGNIALIGPVSTATLGTVVQNTLNDQKIQTVTAVNATVNSLQIVRLQNLESSLRGAIVDSLRR